MPLKSLRSARAAASLLATLIVLLTRTEDGLSSVGTPFRTVQAHKAHGIRGPRCTCKSRRGLKAPTSIDLLCLHNARQQDGLSLMSIAYTCRSANDCLDVSLHRRGVVYDLTSGDEIHLPKQTAISNGSGG